MDSDDGVMDFLIRNLKSRTDNGRDPVLQPQATVIHAKAWEMIERFAEVGSGFSVYPAYADHPDRTTRKEKALKAIRAIYAEAGVAITNDL